MPVHLPHVPPKSKAFQKTIGGKKIKTKVSSSQAKESTNLKDNRVLVHPNLPSANFQFWDVRYENQGNEREVPDLSQHLSANK